MGESALRLAAFAALFALFAIAEAAAPDRPGPADRRRRWPTNLALSVVGGAAARLLGPFSAFAAASWAAQHGVGLIHVVAAPGWIAATACALGLDLALYVQHRALHAIPLLWRVHAPHHADRHLDVTTGLRFHPLEIVLSGLWKAAVAAALGAPPSLVLAFEVALNGFALFNHANLALPPRVERALRLVLVTPRIHRLHHDRAAGRASPNFGFSIGVWDRAFGTWKEGPEPVLLGLAEGPEDPARLDAALAQPFTG